MIVPEAGAGTSASTLSVETSTTVSPSATESPSETCHSRMVPSVTDSPISGITISRPPPSSDLPADTEASSVVAVSGDSWGSSAVAAPAPFEPSAIGGPPPFGSISAIGLPTSIVSSTSTRSLVTVPDEGAGTSASTFSVETSTIVWPSSTVSPSETCHSSTVPSVTDSPISGIKSWTFCLVAIPLTNCMTFPKAALHYPIRAIRVHRRPALFPDELSGWGRRLAERAGDHVREADRAGERDRHPALRAGERSHPEPGRPLRRPDLDPGRRRAQHVLALRILARRWIEHPHDLIIALPRHEPSGLGRRRCKFPAVVKEVR